MKIDKKCVALVVIAAAAIILNIVGAFVLPQQLVTQISLNGSAAQPMNKYLYLVFSAVLIGVCSAAGIFLREKNTRYLVIDCVLFVANAAVFIGNIQGA